MNARVDEPELMLEPLAYHVEVRDYLKSHERELWDWFSSAQAQANDTETLRMDLLKSTYRLDRETHPGLHQHLDDAKARLQLDIPVTLYQAQNNPQLNAALCYIRGQGHIVFSGPVFSLLREEELKSVIGHELAHFHLWARDGGEFHIADRLIQAVAKDPRASGSHEQTARRYQLYTEIFADRGSLHVTRDPHPVVAGLVKIGTGLQEVSAAGYLKQAEEIFANGNVATDGISHPETFIRARALALWQEKRQHASDDISAMIEGAGTIDDLDLIGQKRLAAATRGVLERLLRPKWFQTTAALGHARMFFDDFHPGTNGEAAWGDALKSRDRSVREYLCYLLLDFVTVDPDLDELPLAAALELSREMQLEEPFEKLAAKELKMRARDVRRIRENAAAMLANAEAGHE